MKSDLISHDFLVQTLAKASIELGRFLVYETDRCNVELDEKMLAFMITKYL
ncbi:MAG: hypothetical protein MUD00_02535 [Candidatus Pacebacteria bacterium]|nr:hypothetical protein [Candidatus Paceibacterota bacterium]